MSYRRENALHRLSSAWMFGIVLLLFRLFYLYDFPYDLYADEAQYWYWSLTPDWGYFSMPPMVAWVIWLTTSACGDASPFCIKLASPIFHFFTGLILYGIGRHLYNRAIGFWSALTYWTLPGVTVSAALVSADPALLFFWALALYGLIRGLKDWHIKWWVLVGVATGLGLLSHYSMILFPVSAALYLLLSKNNRIYLFSIKFWLAWIIAFAIYWQNFAWNFSQGFFSSLHTKDSTAGSGLAFHPNELLEFFGAQFGVFGPLLFTVLCFMLLMRYQQLTKKDHFTILFSFIIPFLLLISLFALFSSAQANWAVPIYIAGTVVVVAYLHRAHMGVLIKFSFLLHIAVMLMLHQWGSIYPSLANAMPGIFAQDPIARIKGYNELGQELKKELALFDSKDLILSNDSKLHAQLLYLLRDENDRPPTIIAWNDNNRIDNHFELTTNAADHLHKNFILITTPQPVDHITNRFDKAEKTGLVTIPASDGSVREYDIYYLNDFQGYE